MNFKSKLLLFFFTICLYSSLLSQNHNGSYLSTQFQFVDSEGVNGPLKSLKTVITVNVVGFQGYVIISHSGIVQKFIISGKPDTNINREDNTIIYTYQAGYVMLEGADPKPGKLYLIEDFKTGELKTCVGYRGVYDYYYSLQSLQ